MPEAEDGLIHVLSPYSISDSLKRLEDAIASRGLMLFAHIDHGGEAAKMGLEMPPAHVLIFGSPVAGTPLMIAAPTSAIDLPLKILVWEAGDGSVRVTYNSPEYVAKRHGIPATLIKNISGIRPLIDKALE